MEQILSYLIQEKEKQTRKYTIKSTRKKGRPLTIYKKEIHSKHGKINKTQDGIKTLEQKKE